jgi:ribosomal protein S18 acetylase RimI-like enzyme
MIRQVRREELYSLVEVYTSAYSNLAEYAYSSRHDIKGYLRWLYNGDPEGFFVALIEEGGKGKAVGFVSVHSNWWDRSLGQIGEIHEIAVRGDHQGRGIGRGLMDVALEYAKEQGCRCAGLWVGEKNVAAIAWYKRVGFSERGRWGVWIRMIKSL